MVENSKQMFALLIPFRIETMDDSKCGIAVTTSYFYVFHQNALIISQEIPNAFLLISYSLGRSPSFVLLKP